MPEPLSRETRELLERADAAMSEARQAVNRAHQLRWKASATARPEQPDQRAPAPPSKADQGPGADRPNRVCSLSERRSAPKLAPAGWKNRPRK